MTAVERQTAFAWRRSANGATLPTMDARVQDALNLIDAVCAGLDRARAAAAPAAVGLALSLGACGGETSERPSSDAGAEICSGGVDEDGDGLVDCSDPDCSGVTICGSPIYSMPFEGDCANGIDDDGDGYVDCTDPDCAATALCLAPPPYGIPYESICNDGVDNDGDGTTDCVDTDCLGYAGCTGDAYGIPYETQCSDGADDDNDGLVDCQDVDCCDYGPCSDAGICSIPLPYGIPF
jgi:hypothetical protein